MGCEAFGVDQGLFAFVVLRSQMQVGLRDFDVIAKNRIKFHLQRCNSGALPFALLDLSEKLLAMAAEIAQIV